MGKESLGVKEDSLFDFVWILEAGIIEQIEK